MKYFFFDIDGTLAVGRPGEQYVPESAQYTLKALEEAGHMIAIATGRSYMRAIDYMHQLGFKHMVCDGGNAIVLNDELLCCDPLNREDCLALIAELEARGMVYAVTTDMSGVRYTADDRFLKYSEDFPYMQGVLKEGMDINQEEKIYKIYVACAPGVEDTLVNLNKLTYGRFNDRYIYVQPDDKQKGIRHFLEIVGGDVKDVVVFGDHVNDISMFSSDWINIAVGNAVEQLKEKATYVTDAAEDDGIYHACLHYGWIKPFNDD